MKLRWAPVLLLLTASCRQPIVVDTSAAKLIPRDVAIDRLKEALATADVAVCSAPKNRHFFSRCITSPATGGPSAFCCARLDRSIEATAKDNLHR